MPGKQLTDLEIGRIDGFRSSGKTINEIACIMQRSRKTISRFMKKWRECSPGKVPSHKKRPGKKSKINEHASRIMKYAFLKSPRKSCKQLKNEHPVVFNNVKVRTMQSHACRRLKFKSRVARKKPLLTQKHIEKRYKFALKTKNWTVDQWRRVIWSDEATFQVCGQLPKKVRRPLYRKGNNYGNPWKRKYLVPTKKFPQKILMWCCMSGTAGK